MINKITPLLVFIASAIAQSTTNINNSDVEISQPVKPKLTQIKDCGTTSAIKFDNKSEDDIEKFTMNVNESINDATITYSIVKSGLSLLSFDGSFCDFLSESNIDCPVDAGKYTLNTIQQSPSINSSPSNYTMHFEIKNNETKLGCMDAQFEIPQSETQTLNQTD